MHKHTAALLALCLGIGWAASARAASVGLTARCILPPGWEPQNPPPGVCDPIATLELTVSVTADAGELDDRVFGAINYPAAIVDALPAMNSQALLPGDGWTLAAQSCTSAFCVAFDQTNLGGAAAPAVTSFAIGTVYFGIDPGTPVGTVLNFTWRTAPSTQRLDWFGVTNAPGLSLTLIPFAVPEPATAALLGLGLLGLGIRRRHLA